MREVNALVLKYGGSMSGEHNDRYGYRRPIWLGLGIKGLHMADSSRWARQMFLFSLIIITLQSVMISADSWLQ